MGTLTSRSDPTGSCWAERGQTGEGAGHDQRRSLRGTHLQDHDDDDDDDDDDDNDDDDQEEEEEDDGGDVVTMDRTPSG
jgi:hypothetical protein